MSSEWKTSPLGECVIFQSGSTPSKSNSDYWGPGIPWISAKDMKRFWVDVAEDTLTPAGAEVAARIIEPGTTLLLTRGMTLHNTIPIVRTRFKSAFNQDVKAVIPREGVSADFIPYLLLGNKLRLHNLVDSAGHGTGRLNTESLKALIVAIPPLNEQNSLAALFGSIDERIALLSETSATLEAIAQALFRSWFVDFDPVHANAGTQSPALSSEIQALFPAIFTDSPQGPIPDGWKAGQIGDFAEQKKGSVNPLLKPETLFEHFSLPAFDNQQTPVLELGTEIKSNKTPLPKEAVLLSKLNPHIPRLWLPIEYGDTAVCSTEFLAYSPKGASSKEFIYCAFSSEQFKQHLCQLVTGTSNSHQRVKPDQVLIAAAVLPSDEVFKQFELIVNPIFAQVHKNRIQAQTLTALRDTLLPRLISGQLRLVEAEAVLTEIG